MQNHFGPVQNGIYWGVLLSGALVGVPDRIATVIQQPTAINLMLLFVSSGLLALLSLLRCRSF